MSGSERAEDVFTVLLVCTGNICRSALAERLGRAYLNEVLGPAAEQIRLVSAGTGAVMGSGMHPDSARALQGLGGEPAGHVAQQLDERLAAAADLTLTMTRAHRKSVLQMAPWTLARTFTLREAADLLRLAEVQAIGNNLAARGRDLVRTLADARARRQSSAADDVPDPIGQPLEAHQEAADLIAEALLLLLSRLAALPDEPAEQLPRRPAASRTRCT